MMEFTPKEFEAYRQALKERICSLCQKSGYAGSCAIGENGVCPFDLHLPRLLDAVLSTPRSQRIADYVPRIRELVCSHCVNQEVAGVCASRDLCYCSLDSFLLLVVTAIEEVHDRLHAVSPARR